jgi:chorismate-pyruvate lyase
VRAALDVKPDEPLGYRRVRLKCGEKVLSEADNWYVPARLTPEMNRVLKTTDTPFGKAVAALHFRRHTLKADLLWRPLPAGWEMGAAAAPEEASGLAIPGHVLEHRAVLLTDGEPFSEVVETYTGDVLAFPPPK